MQTKLIRKGGKRQERQRPGGSWKKKAAKKKKKKKLITVQVNRAGELEFKKTTLIFLCSIKVILKIILRLPYNYEYISKY